MVFLIIVLFLIVLFFVLVAFKFMKAYKIKLERVIMFTGTMGSGKTLCATNKDFSLRSKVMLELFWTRLKSYLIPWKKKLPKNDKVYVYSNIPLRSKYYIPLESDHLLRKKEMYQNCIILIDEFGSFCNQYDWSNPYIIEQLTSFVRFSRHWLNAYLLITDQTSDSIPKQVRDRLSSEYHLARCRSWLFRYKVIDVYPVQHITDDSSNVVQVDQDNIPYLIFRFKAKKCLYDTRCYSETYYKGFVFEREKDDSKNLKTRYLLDFEPNAEFLKKYKQDKRDAKHSVLEASLDSQ